jgi:hypothetical protein
VLKDGFGPAQVKAGVITTEGEPKYGLHAFSPFGSGNAPLSVG